jgi:hypothetical protein
MREARCVSLIPRTTRHSDSEQYMYYRLQLCLARPSSWLLIHLFFGQVCTCSNPLLLISYCIRNYSQLAYNAASQANNITGIVQLKLKGVEID